MAPRFSALRRFGLYLAAPLIAIGRAIRFKQEAQQHARPGQPKRLEARSYASVGLMAVGAVLLLYVGTQYGQMYMEQRRLTREWNVQQQAVRAPESRSATAAPNANSQPAHTTGLTRLTIPRIRLDSIVVEGTSDHDLLLGPGHLQDTPEPGQIGNAVISGHRDTFFRHVHELNKGDVITVRRDGKTYEYVVTGKKIVKPNAMWVIRPTPDHELTLLTCYPTYYIGPAPERLVVLSRLRQSTTGNLAQTTASTAPETSRKLTQ